MESFTRTLDNSFSRWETEEKRGIWVHIPASCSDIVPLCAKLGFEFQHAKKRLLVTTQRLPVESHSRLPHGPTHQVRIVAGIGEVIMHHHG